MMKINVNTSSSYPIYLGSGLLDDVYSKFSKIFPPKSRLLIISDTNVFRLYGKRVADSLQKGGFQIVSYVFPAGESQKQLSTINEIYQKLSENNFTRSDGIVALGGGVAGDMAGFAAATFLRGIPFAQIPTSLLAQIDSSIGGKTGIDLTFGKNLVGAFHQPSIVLVDPDTLQTLPSRYFCDGIGEAIKYGCILDSDLFDLVKDGIKKENLESMIFSCLNCKKQVVEKDEKDTGLRMILNFGHTLGHAIEKLDGYKNISHGEAVSMGMLLITRLSEKLGITDKGTSKQIYCALKHNGLPTNSSFALQDILQATVLDKKSFGNEIRLILLKHIGCAEIHPISRTRFLQFTESDLLPLEELV